MTTITPFLERAKHSLRETVLDAATELLIERGYSGLRMADVAAAAGVSRQTVYNEFGGKPALVEAVALRTTAEFMAGSEHRFRDAADAITGIHRSVSYIVRHARENRLVAAVVGTAEAEDLLPFLTTKGTPIMRTSVQQVSNNLRWHLPALAEEHANLLGETIVRLSISYLLLPDGDAAHAADSVCAAIAPALREYSSA
ncbi:MAG: TetR family transcriptional regulator [Pseudonocardiaceae bacterium]|nr:TetR family transcriptional regulator [Pseudonocardiaceae bacterium]